MLCRDEDHHLNGTPLVNGRADRPSGWAPAYMRHGRTLPMWHMAGNRAAEIKSQQQ